MKRIIIYAIKLYQKGISPYIQKSCRHVPTCSDYAIDAIEHFGILKGSLKALWRILRCNPFSRGGYDPAVK